MVESPSTANVSEWKINHSKLLSLTAQVGEFQVFSALATYIPWWGRDAGVASLMPSTPITSCIWAISLNQRKLKLKNYNRIQNKHYRILGHLGYGRHIGRHDIKPKHVQKMMRSACMWPDGWPIDKATFLKSRHQTRYLWGMKRSTAFARLY